MLTGQPHLDITSVIFSFQVILYCIKLKIKNNLHNLQFLYLCSPYLFSGSPAILSPSLCVCICVCCSVVYVLYAPKCTSTCIYICTCRCQDKAPSIFYQSLSYFLETGSPNNPEAHCIG